MFDVFPDNPAVGGSRNQVSLRTSLERVLGQRVSDGMPLTRYDVRNRGGGFVERHWNPSNHPVLDPRGDLLYLLHTVTDETDRVLRANAVAAARKADEESRSGRQELRAAALVEDPLDSVINENFESLSAREKEVLKLAIRGKANKVIACALGISARTVEVYRTSILRKTVKNNFLELSGALYELSGAKPSGSIEARLRKAVEDVD